MKAEVVVNSTIKEKFDSYPPEAKTRLYQLRELIFEIAEDERLGKITEELKWGEPSYSSTLGSPIRIVWKPKNPAYVSLFVNCKTILIETYKEIYQDTFSYRGNREITLPLSQPMPMQELRHCISMALKYHQIKKFPLLGQNNER